jgi:hypothetical protein
VMVACGAGAGLAAVYSVPLGGVHDQKVMSHAALRSVLRSQKS